jgi:hypothetical protein
MVACTRLAAKVSRKTILFHDGLEQSVKDAFIHFLETQNVRLVRDDFVENQLHASLFLEKFLGTIGIDGHLVVFEGILIRQYVVRNDPYIRICCRLYCFCWRWRWCTEVSELSELSSKRVEVVVGCW